VECPGRSLVSWSEKCCNSIGWLFDGQICQFMVDHSCVVLVLSQAGELEKRMTNAEVDYQKHIDDIASSSDSSDSDSDDNVHKS